MGLTKKLFRGTVRGAPLLAFARRKPKTAALAAAGAWVADRVMPRRRRRSNLGRTAVQGLGAAAVAIPLGLWMGRKMRGGGEETSES